MRRLATILALVLAPVGAAQAAASLTSAGAIRAAMKVKPGLFSLFPKRIASKPCRIPRGRSGTSIPGTCATRVTVGPGYSGRITVSFSETWTADGARVRHTWRVIESPAGRPLEVRSTGAPAPQLAR